MAKSIQNTGQLREFLVDMMVGVKNGMVDTEKARNLVKLAGQVNESFYAETKVMKIKAEAGQAIQAFGSLPINESASS